MKRLFEPVAGAIMGWLSWAAFTDFVLSILIAFITGAFAYLGKWACAKCVQFFSKRKNVFVSKTREAINSHNSPDDTVIF
jgi:H+/Cl- antiporter ClcA